MSNALAVREESVFELGKVFAESGMFPNTRKASEAIVKIIAGREFGLGPMAAMNGIHMVDGKPTLAANLIAGQIKRHPNYDYRVIRRDEDGCELEFFGATTVRRIVGRESQPTTEMVKLGTMTFEKKDAERAGLLGKQNWKKYPRDMYFARCLTAGARTYCPDVLGGSPIYTAEELDADTFETPQERPSRHLVRDPDPSPATADVEVQDAEVVSPADETISADALKRIQAVYKASGMTRTDLCWCLLSLGIESLPEDPTGEQIGEVMASLTREQGEKLEAFIKGEDDSVPGSGEAA